MPSLPLPQLIGDARTQWLSGDTQAWTRYVACCLELDAELRAVPTTKVPVSFPIPPPSSAPSPQPS